LPSPLPALSENDSAVPIHTVFQCFHGFGPEIYIVDPNCQSERASYLKAFAHIGWNPTG